MRAAIWRRNGRCTGCSPPATGACGNVARKVSQNVDEALGWQPFGFGLLLGVVVPIVLTFGVLVLLYRYLPRHRPRWLAALIGAGAAALGFQAVQIGLGWYLAGPCGLHAGLRLRKRDLRVPLLRLPERQRIRDLRDPDGAARRWARSPVWFLTIILVMTETLSLSAVKARLSELVDRVENEADRIVVTRNGRPAAVLVSTDDLESLEETLAVLSDRELMRKIREGERAAEQVDVVPLEELKHRYAPGG